MDVALDQLKFDANGLIPLIVQDVANGQVLMMAWMNREALEKTLATGKIHTYSRSRGRLALKGESSAPLSARTGILDRLRQRCGAVQGRAGRGRLPRGIPQLLLPQVRERRLAGHRRAGV